ncbi:threonine--tRNA ligase [Microlunatus panaciterrae]|uniref:Threonine--tRNA ligase n=1 Tax=Microlunatus panaciterrae TaxID=400768 RepID=A0ABS2RDQ2_9ACTN|nr:threonine--tRNA ligase [Microlunatus panaciterrae]MBM7797129.1 threonyl-tRNA synthetase [Microlunatus panaciterrae]
MKNDHRELGRELHLFATSPLVGSGLPLWLPDGAVIRGELEKLAAEEAERSGCRRVYTPVMAKRELYERSGHWDKFSADMFPVMNVGGESFVLRPANCPHHAMVYAAQGRSIRDLPFRLSEVGSMFRSELSGVLSGLARVRQINLDDAHVFCAPEQVAGEVVLALEAIQRCYRLLGLEVSYYRLSLDGPGGGFLGTRAQWDDAEAQLRRALDQLELPYVAAPGEAAFYGPKIDVQVLDGQGREETLSTVQLDFNQPERFNLEYVGSDGGRHRPVMIHRGLLGSMERMTAQLIERFAGRMPPWLSPVQVRVLPVSASQQNVAEGLANRLRQRGIRTELSSDGSLGARIRASRLQRVAYLAIIGAEEARADTVNVVLPALEQRGSLAAVDFVEKVSSEVAERVQQPRPLP